MIEESKTTVLGIDPGLSGGIVVYQLDFGVTATHKMPETEMDVWELFESISLRHSKNSVTAYVEKITGFVGGKGPPGSKMFVMGANYGGLRMACLGNAIRLVEVTAPTWQKALGIPKKDKADSQTKWKNLLKGKAQQLFPNLKITLAFSDALLIAEYGKLKEQGKV